MDGDGTEEIRTVNDVFYGKFLKIKNLECSITPGSYEGYADIQFPQYVEIIKKNGEYTTKDVTFSEKFQPYLKPYFRKVEKRLEKIKNTTLESGDSEIVPLIQYVYYMKKIGKAKQGMEKIRSAKIKIKYSCFENFQEKEKVEETFEKFLEKIF